ncbi:MAG: tRNA-binding protein [Bacteroidia bacterium]|jgi:tRNA-binding protein|nr:tRNA-binding protein [Bacteroidia bacterium]
MLFNQLDLRVGTIIDATPFTGGTIEAFVLQIDFGKEIGILKSVAQLTHSYEVRALFGKQIIAIVNIPPKQIGKTISQCLVLGAVGANKTVSLLTPDFEMPNGSRIA